MPPLCPAAKLQARRIKEVSALLLSPIYPIAIIRNRVWQEIPADKLYNISPDEEKTDQGKYLEWDTPADSLINNDDGQPFPIESEPIVDTRGQAEKLPGRRIIKNTPVQPDLQVSGSSNSNGK